MVNFKEEIAKLIAPQLLVESRHFQSIFEEVSL